VPTLEFFDTHSGIQVCHTIVCIHSGVSYISVCIHSHISATHVFPHYTCMCMSVCMWLVCACMCVYIHTNMCVCVYTYKHVIHKCTCTVAAHTCIHRDLHTYIQLPAQTPPHTHTGRPDAEYGNNIVPRRRVPPLRSSPTRGGRAHSRDRYRNGRNNQQRNPTTAGAGLIILGSLSYEGLRLTV